jgi:hypothetical protein
VGTRTSRSSSSCSCTRSAAAPLAPAPPQAHQPRHRLCAGSASPAPAQPEHRQHLHANLLPHTPPSPVPPRPPPQQPTPHALPHPRTPTACARGPGPWVTRPPAADGAARLGRRPVEPVGQSPDAPRPRVTAAAATADVAAAAASTAVKPRHSSAAAAAAAARTGPERAWAPRRPTGDGRAVRPPQSADRAARSLGAAARARCGRYWEHGGAPPAGACGPRRGSGPARHGSRLLTRRDLDGLGGERADAGDWVSAFVQVACVGEIASESDSASAPPPQRQPAVRRSGATHSPRPCSRCWSAAGPMKPEHRAATVDHRVFSSSPSPRPGPGHCPARPSPDRTHNGGGGLGPKLIMHRSAHRAGQHQPHCGASTCTARAARGWWGFARRASCWCASAAWPPCAAMLSHVGPLGRRP